MDGSSLFHDKICISGFVLNLKIKNTILEPSFIPRMVWVCICQSRPSFEFTGGNFLDS